MDADIAAPVTSCAPMPRWRIALVATLAVVLIVGHVFDIVTQTEHWPFSYYPMYGRVQSKSRLRIPAFYGVMQRGNRTKGQRITSPEYVPQLGEARLRNILIASWGADGTAPKAKRETAAILARLPEALRVPTHRWIAQRAADGRGTIVPDYMGGETRQHQQTGPQRRRVARRTI